MKRKYNDEKRFDNKKGRRVREIQLRAAGFTCWHCRQWVVINEYMGTANRNHCNLCLWSKHVDVKKGDRRSQCLAGMKPVGLTLRQEGFGRTGEIMLVHVCAGCNKISINRTAADDPTSHIEQIFEDSLQAPPDIVSSLRSQGITLMRSIHLAELRVQLYGKPPL
ncbi:MAG TPA: RNHCP domain-containing protein [Candidatus Saccharimonadia bacterium]|nr:RNHCP domain-containing protein [Candidatus Saccharimonadia bacterium]